jgi:signal transduction histidine kinase
MTRHLRARRGVPVEAEDVIRFTHDFRHAGLETRTLLAIHARVENLFVAGEMHIPFLNDLVDLSRKYESETAPSLERLAVLARTAFPDLRHAADVESVTAEIGRLLARRPVLDADVATLAEWRDRLLPLLRRQQDLLPRLLDEVDRRCSCDVATVLADACASHADALRDARVEVVLRTPGEGVLRVLAGRKDLILIIENLLTNALAAMEGLPERRIVIEARRDDRKAVLQFSDTGSGVRPGDEDRIFAYGFSTRPGGKGYGLARSREILGHYGGSIVLERDTSSPGATFRITLRALSEDLP